MAREGFIDESGWDETVARCGVDDVYFSLAYHRLAAGPGQTHRCFVFSRDGEQFALPILIAPVAGTEFFDFTTCYGYSGPLTTSTNQEFLRASWEAFRQHCEAIGVIAGFIRFHPLLRNVVACPPLEFANTRFDRNTVFIDLTQSSEKLWNSSIDSNHYDLRRARREGAEFLVDSEWEHLDRFVELYRATMELRAAAVEYRFSDDYFFELRRSLKGRAFLACIKIDGEVAAGAIILCSVPFAHYHLSASDRARRSLSLTSLLLVETAKHLQSLGYSAFHLGGGTDSSEDNSLYQYKRRFSSDVASFHTGSVILQRQYYEQLCRDWEQRVSPETVARYRGYTLKYRFDL